jgi:hypothetical protein
MDYDYKPLNQPNDFIQNQKLKLNKMFIVLIVIILIMLVVSLLIYFIDNDNYLFSLIVGLIIISIYEMVIIIIAFKFLHNLLDN